MSNEHTFNAKTEFNRVSILPLVTAANAVYGDLTPLLGTHSLLEENLKEQLRKLFEVFAKGVEYGFLATGHTAGGVVSIMYLFKEWNKLSPTLRRDQLELVAQRLLYAEANSVDGQKAYMEAKINADPLFRQLLDTYGPDLVVEVASVGKYTKELNFEKSTIQNIAIRVISHLEQSDSSMTTFMKLIQDLNQAIRNFLEDEQISLTQSPKDIPFLSANPHRVWQEIDLQLGDIDRKLNRAIMKYMTWFKNPYESPVEIIRDDLQLRASMIVLPNIRLQAPVVEVPPVKLTRSWFPSDLIQTVLMSDGYCAIQIANIERSKPGMTTVKFNFVTRATQSWFLRLQNLVVHAKVVPVEVDSPLRIVSYHPNNVKDLREDSHFEPKHCLPHLDIITASNSSTSTVNWKFSRPMFQWPRGTVFPTNLSISLDIEHVVEIQIQVCLIFTYRRLFIWKVVESVPSRINAPSEPPATAAEAARS